ncbi:MAG: restriction endonuclease [Methylotenera sp.]|uniref:restriction endonuclease n=1 Tax=Methylotenera sp. TaxID=2051956 RepID=UPI00248A1175|nr:restriction endonuclease [Methylotenera sp.]MDI1310492.1 restriction endonuclease [Methylotenera sp.]
MARKKKTSPIEDLLDIASSINWKVSLLIALISYFIFHHFAIQAIPLSSDLQSVTNSLPKQIFINFSKVLQYIFPVIFIIGACVSSFKNKHRIKLVDKQTGIDSIRDMSWQDFELLVGEAFRRKGFEVKENGGGGADGGIDLVLTKNGKKSIVQCKRWKTFSIGVPLIRELYGAMTSERANDCIFVSSGNYTAEARLFAEDKPIWLIDGSELSKMIAEVQVQPNIVKPSLLKQSVTTSPQCPLCGSAMVKRIARKGANAGNEFWGCSAYPRCRGTS